MRKIVDKYTQWVYNISTRLRERYLSKQGGQVMDSITKALKDLAKAVKSNDTVERVKVTITLKKPKPNKANGADK